MIFENQYGLVDIQIKDPDAVAVNLSAGPDSTVLLWMVAKSVTTQDIIAKVVTTEREDILDNVKQIIEKMEMIFPHIEFKLSHTWSDGSIPINEFLNSIPHGTTQVFTGLQCNPPKHELIKHDLWSTRSRYRDREYMPFPDEYKGQCWPMRFTDKQYLAQVIKDHGLDWVNTMTTTCSSGPTAMRPCKKCFGCRERFIYMGSYDWGVK